MTVNTAEDKEKLLNKIALEELKKAVYHKTTFAFLGSGCSAKIGYPSWSKLITDLEQRVSQKDPTNHDMYRNVDSKKEALWYAGFLKGRLDESEFASFMHDTFHPQLDKIGVFHQQLMSIPFRHFLTLNYDTILEETARKLRMQIDVFCWKDQDKVRNFLQNLHTLEEASSERSIFHLHGLYDKSDTIILTETDYMQLYFTDNLTLKALWSIIASFRMVFIGFGLSDLDLLQFFRKAHWDLGRPQAKHFVITHENVPIKRFHDRHFWREKYGLEPIYYSTLDDPNHGELDKIVSELAAIRDSGLSSEEKIKKEIEKFDENTFFKS